MFKKGLISFCISVMLLSVCSSCSWWFDSYSDYDVGMFINGVEYHELIWGHNIGFGFYCNNNPTTKVLIVSGGGGFLVPRHQIIHGDDRFVFHIMMYIDSTQFDSRTKYFFKELDISPFEYVDQLSPDNMDVSEPLLIGSITNTKNRCEYLIKQGWLLLGDYYYPSPDSSEFRFECARFEFYAESEDGQSVTVTKGYCKI